MKRVLITGKNSYIGSAFANWLTQWPDEYSCEKLSLRGDGWQNADFSQYDVVFHAAAIVHRKGESKESYDLVNHKLTVDIALKAQREGVAHFIFMSTMSVYGLSCGEINEYTIERPSTEYGRSKYAAEIDLNNVANNSFVVSHIRPPMVYGLDAPGNFTQLVKLVDKLTFFPDFPKQRRSMIYLGNLLSFLTYIVDYRLGGTFMPQNEEYVNTSELVKAIAQHKGRSIRLTKLLNPLIHVAKTVPLLSKLFGTLYYSSSMPGNPYKLGGEGEKYCYVNFEESIHRSLKNANETRSSSDI